jgi:hypothetical protein
MVWSISIQVGPEPSGREDHRRESPLRPLRRGVVSSASNHMLRDRTEDDRRAILADADILGSAQGSFL